MKLFSVKGVKEVKKFLVFVFLISYGSFYFFSFSYAQEQQGTPSANSANSVKPADSPAKAAGAGTIPFETPFHPGAAKAPPALLPSAVQPPPPPPPPKIPPALIVRGKEYEMHRVFMDTATVGKEVKIEFIAFDMDPAEALTAPKTYWLPDTATMKFEPDIKNKNKGAAVLSWTPTDKDIGVHAFVVELTNGKGASNRIAFFYDVKK